MTTKRVLDDFKRFCLHKYGIEIQSNVIEEFLNQVSSEGMNDNFSVNSVKSDCKLNNYGCSHINFDTAKCEDCSY